MVQISKFCPKNYKNGLGKRCVLELVYRELNHLVAILHVYARGLIFLSKKKMLLFFKKKMDMFLHF